MAAMFLLLSLVLAVGLVASKTKTTTENPRFYNPNARPPFLEENANYHKDNQEQEETSDSDKYLLDTTSIKSIDNSLLNKRLTTNQEQETTDKPKETLEETRLSEDPNENSDEFTTEKIARPSVKHKTEKIPQKSPLKGNKKVTNVFPKINGSYLILAPKVLRPGRPYVTTISVKNIANPMMIYLVIQIDGNNTLRNLVEAREGKPTKVRFQIPEDFRDGKYKLIAFGQNENQKFIVLNSTDLEYQSKIASVFIQTDKPAYKQNQLVRFRVILTNPELKPYTEPVNIYITCPYNFRVAQWENVKENSGVILKEFQLPNGSYTGMWKINVEVEDEKVSEPLLFIEDDGNIPKFDVVIESARYILYDKTSTFPIKIIAKYPFGKPVNGSAVINIQQQHIDNFEQSSSKSDILNQITVVVNGEAHVEIPLQYIKFPTYSEEISYTIYVTVKDTLSKTEYTGSAPITLFRDKYRVDFVLFSQTFKPGLKFPVNVKLELFDGGFLPDEDVKINISYGFIKYEDKSWIKDIYPVPPIGLVVLDIYPNEDTDIIYIKADYQGFQNEIKVEKKVSSILQEYIQLTSDSPQYGTGDKALLSINCTSKVPSVNLVVFARNSILTTGLINMKNKKTIKVNLPITEAMIPATTLAVYYITNEGQLLADSLNLTIGGPLTNNVSVHFYEKDGAAVDPENEAISPGSEILVSGMTSPNSHVFINIQDEGAYLLKPEDLFTLKKIYKELYAYNNVKRESGQFYELSELMDACKMLLEAGFAVLTNGCELQESNDNHVSFNNREVFNPPTYSTAEIYSKSLQQNQKNKIKTRRNFPETWLWMDTVAGPDGKFQSSSIIPDTMTMWVASAFSMNTDVGLGIMEYPAKIRVSKPFFIVLLLPYSAKRNEILKFDVLVFHNFNESFDVTVKLDKTDYFEVPQTTNVDPVNKKAYVNANGYISQAFSIIPTVIGTIPIRVSAISSVGKDSEERKIIIKPEGVTILKNETSIVNFGKEGKVSKKFTVQLPKDLIADSDKVFVNILGNGFGLPLKHVEKYFSTNFKKVNFIPDIHEKSPLQLLPFLSRNLAIFRYLDVTSQFPSDIHITKYLELLQKDYNNFLRLRQSDGSFIYQGFFPTLLTSFAVKYLSELQQYISFDNDIIASAVNWLANKQSYDGSFDDLGDQQLKQFLDTLSHNLEIDISAEVVLMLLKAQIPTDRREIANTIHFLETHVANNSVNIVGQIHLLAKLLYVFTLAESPKAKEVLAMLKNEISLDAPVTLKKNNYDYSNNLITNSYLIQYFIHSGEMGKALMFSRYVADNFEFDANFGLILENVRALEAMTVVAEYAYHPETEMDLVIKAGDDFSQQLTVNYENVNVMQLVEIPHVTNFKQIEISAKGHGGFFILLEWQYNIAEKFNSSNIKDIFTLEIKPSFQPKRILNLNICALRKENTQRGDSDVVNVEFPEGYEPYETEKLAGNNSIVSTETHEHNVFVYIYLQTEIRTCFDIQALRQNGKKIFSDIPVSLFVILNEASTIVTKKYNSPVQKSKHT